MKTIVTPQDVKEVVTGEGLLEEIIFENQLEIASIVCRLGTTYNVSNVRFFKWKATNDRDVILRTVHYLDVIFCRNNLTTKNLEKFNVDDVVLIVSWDEYNAIDNHSKLTIAIKYSVAVEVFENLLREIKAFN